MPVLAVASKKSRKTPNCLSVLLADGDTALTELTRRYLLLRGFEVDTVSGGLEALQMLHQASYQILVLDFDLPWGGGDGLLSLMKEDTAFQDVQVILTSSHVVPSTEWHASPVIGLLRKPYSLDSLLAEILKVVENSAVCSPSVQNGLG